MTYVAILVTLLLSESLDTKLINLAFGHLYKSKSHKEE